MVRFAHTGPSALGQAAFGLGLATFYENSHLGALSGENIIRFAEII